MSDDAIAKKKMKTPGTAKPTTEGWSWSKMLEVASKDVKLEKLIRASALLAQSRVLDYGGHPLGTGKRRLGHRSRQEGLHLLRDAVDPGQAPDFLREWELEHPKATCPLLLPRWSEEVARIAPRYDPKATQ